MAGPILGCGEVATAVVVNMRVPVCGVDDDDVTDEEDVRGGGGSVLQ